VRRLLHLVRGDAIPPVVADRDWVVYLQPTAGPGPLLANRGEPPLPAGPIDHDQLVTLLTAADLVVTW